jgi:hypothetical protein
MAREWGTRDARAWSNAHEYTGQALTSGARMDLYNNAVGLSSVWASGTNGSAAEDVVVAGLASLCWLVGEGNSATCG